MNLQLVRGVIINIVNMRVLVGTRFLEIWQNWEQHKNTTPDTDHNFYLFLTQKNRLKTIGEKIGVSIYEWPIQSLLYGKQYVIGVIVGKINFLKVLHTTSRLTVDFTYLDSTLRKKYDVYNILEDLETIILPI